MTPTQSYGELYAAFRCSIPARSNMAADVSDRRAADPTQLAMIVEAPEGGVRERTFREVQSSAGRLADLLVALAPVALGRAGPISVSAAERAKRVAEL